MKAVYIEQFGGPEVLKYGDLPDPSPGPDQIVVDIFAASINGADWNVRAGHYGKPQFPLILGRDFSGLISALGTGVDDLRIGDEDLACWRQAVKEPTPKKLLLVRQLLRRSRRRCRMSLQRPWL